MSFLAISSNQMLSQQPESLFQEKEPNVNVFEDLQYLYVSELPLQLNVM